MRLLLALLATLAVAGSAIPEDDRVCTIQLAVDLEMHSEIAEMAMVCLASPETETHRLRETYDLEETQTFFKDYCENTTVYQACLNELSVKSEACQNETRQQVFLIFKELLETVLDTGCNNTGELLVSIFHGYVSFSSNDSQNNFAFQKCFNNGASRMRLIGSNSEFNPASKLFAFYNEVLSFRDCFKFYFEGDASFSKAVERFLHEITERIKCVHPQDGSTVLCKSLDLGSIDATGYCPITREENDPREMDDLILAQMEMCMRKVHPEDETFEDINDLDGYRTFSKNFCNKTKDTERCLNKAIVTSATCQSRADHEVFKVVADFVSGAVDSVCVARGEPLAIFMHHVTRGDNGALGHENPIRECSRVLMTSLDTPAEDIHAKTRALYRELHAFKRCFLEKLRGDDMAVFHAELVLSGMLRGLRCVDPQTGAGVPCQTLVPTPAPNTVCPYVGVREGDHGAYNMLTDFAFTCLTVPGPDIHRLDDLNDLADFKAFFREYCADQTLVAACLGDVSTSAEACALEDDRRMLHVLTDLLGNTVRTGCKEGGDSLAATVYGIKKHPEALARCKAEAGEGFNSLASQGNMTAFTVGSFNTASQFVQCYSSSVPDQGEFKAESVAFLTLAVRSLQCVNHHGHVVLCETIANDVHAAASR